MFGKVTEDALSAMRHILGTEAVSTGESDRSTHSHDESTHAAVLPDVVAYPRTTDQVSQLLALANDARIPVTGYGAGTSVEGHAVPVAGGIVVDFRDMNRILELHADDFQVTVEPGVLRLDLEDDLGRHGLFFPPDPGANATIGGMVANNAAGIRALKYGATRDHVLALEVVLADGSVVRTGSRSVKQSAGYDLRHLVVGSEGTLGLVTRATLRAMPIPEHFATAVIAFGDLASAAAAATAMIGHGLEPAALELIHGDHMRWLNEDEGTDFVEETTLMLEFSGADEGSTTAALESAVGLCTEATDVRQDLGRTERGEMWRHRHGMRERYVRRSVGSSRVSVDVSVPISRLADLASFATERGKELGFDAPVFGHAGDGNLHLSIAYDTPERQQQAEDFGGALALAAIDMGGTCTGEHGIGIGKRRYLEAEFGPEAVAVMRTIKNALDPNGILNPGKVLPD